MGIVEFAESGVESGASWIKNKIDNMSDEEKKEVAAGAAAAVQYTVNSYDAGRYDPYTTTVTQESPSVGDGYYSAIFE